MPKSRQRITNDLRRAAFLAGAAQLTDGQLLEQFVLYRDENAFESLVRRFGPLVFGTCRRLLHHVQESEDAFQATFLVLARRASAIRRGANLGAWLHGVAIRTALHARRQSRRRHQVESSAPIAPSSAPADETAALAELRGLVDSAIQRLPRRLREPILLCDLMGKTKRQAAEQLACPEGTLSSRLARGRELLRKRLDHLRPEFLSAVGPVLHVPSQNVPAVLCSATANAAVLLFNGGLGLTASTPIMKGVLSSMFHTKL